MKRFTMTIHTVIVLLSLLLAAALLPGALAAPSIINTSGAVYTPTLCLSGVCQSSWPAGSGTSGGWTNTSTETRTLLNMTVQNGAVLFNGTSGRAPTVGAGTQLMWVPEKYAFRAGKTNSYEWEDAYIGHGSVAFGNSNWATGNRSFVGGAFSHAAGESSFAYGGQLYTGNLYSVAFGVETNSSGYASFAAGYLNLVSGNSAVALGALSNATGPVAFAGGYASRSAGYASFAYGNRSLATGDGAVAVGENANASGLYAVALGQTRAAGSGSFAAGRHTAAAASNAITIGSGIDASNQLTNNNANSMIFGFNSTTPTMFINGSAVGIGTTAPTSALHVNTTSSNVFVAYSNAFTNNAWDPVIEAKTYGNYALLGIGNAGNAHPGRIGLGGGTSNSGIQGDGGTVTLFSSAGGNITFGSDMYDTYDERMRITGDGKVGIGTTAPAAALHVNTSSGTLGTFMSTGGDVSLIIGTTAGSQRKGITYDDGTTADWVTFADAGYSPVPQFVIGTGSFYGVRRLVITDSGYVGIGHTNPAGQLHVHTNTSAANMYLSANGTNSFARVWYVTDNSSAPWNVGARNDLTYGGGFSFETNNSGSWQSKLFITPGGSVGIGTSTPSSKLEVYGDSSSITNALMKVQNTYSAAYVPTLDLLAPNLDDNQQVYMGLGQEASSYNRAAWAFNRVANASTSNYMSFGFFSANNLLVIKASGNVGIGTTSPNATLDVQASTRPSIALGNPGISDKGRLFRAVDGQSRMDISSNLYYNGTTYNFDNTSNNASLLTIAWTGFNFRRATASANPASLALSMTIDSSGRIGVGTASPNEGMIEVFNGTVCVDTNNDGTASSCIASESDVRLKENITQITGALGKIQQLRGVTFDWRTNDPEVLAHYPLIARFNQSPHSIGLIAQDVAPVLPEAIMLETIGDNQTQYLQLDYDKITPVLVEGIKEQQAQIDAQDAAQQALQQRVSDLEAQNAQLRSELDALTSAVAQLQR